MLISVLFLVQYLLFDSLYNSFSKLIQSFFTHQFFSQMLFPLLYKYRSTCWLKNWLKYWFILSHSDSFLVVDPHEWFKSFFVKFQSINMMLNRIDPLQLHDLVQALVPTILHTLIQVQYFYQFKIYSAACSKCWSYSHSQQSYMWYSNSRSKYYSFFPIKILLLNISSVT